MLGEKEFIKCFYYNENYFICHDDRQSVIVQLACGGETKSLTEQY